MKEITKTKEEIIKDRLIEIQMLYKYTIDTLEININNLTGMFFGDLELTQDFANYLGTDAQELFKNFQMAIQFLSSINPNYKAPEIPEIKWTKTGEVAEILPINKEVI